MERSQQGRISVNVHPTTLRRALKWGALILLLVAGLSLLTVLQTVLYILVAGLFLAFLLSPVVNFMENRGVDRLLAVLLVFAIIIFVAVLAFEFLVPMVTHELNLMAQALKSQSPTEFIEKLQTSLGDRFPVLANPEVQQELRGRLGGILNSLFQRSIALILDVFSAVVSFVMVAFVTFFFLKDGRRMQKAVISWVPNRYFEMSLNILHKVGVQLGRYIRGQLLVALIVGTLAVIALRLLNIRYSLFIGAIAGLANMIPYFGPIVGGVPAVVVALIDTGSFGVVVSVIVAFASIQLFENVLISPFIVSKSVELHPLTIILVILIGGQMMGLFGMLLAVPAASIIKVTARELYWGFTHYRVFEK